MKPRDFVRLQKPYRVPFSIINQRNSRMGKQNNQNFVNIPYGKLRDKLSYLCELNGIAYIEQEESCISKASFWDKDNIPVVRPAKGV